MADDEKLMRLLLASLNFQALFGAVALSMMMLAALMWGERDAFALLLVSTACVIAARGMDRSMRGIFDGLKFGFNVARILWYAAIVFTVAAATMLV